MRNYFTAAALSEPSFRNFLFAPIIGLAFLMFLPFIGFFLTAQALAAKVAVTWTGIWGMEPAVGEAYLTGSPNKTKVSESNNELEELEKEVLNRRNQKS